MSATTKDPSSLAEISWINAPDAEEIFWMASVSFVKTVKCSAIINTSKVALEGNLEQ